MRFAIAPTLILIFFLTIGDGAGLRRAAQSATTQSDGPKPTIQLTITVTRQISCKGDRDAYTEVFDVDTDYVNKGDKDLTIYTGEDYSPNEKVAITLADMQAEKYVSDSKWDVFFTDDSAEHVIGGNPRPEPPRTLAPGESTKSKSGFGLVLRRKGTVVPMSILPGAYYVRLGVMTKIAESRLSSADLAPTKANGFHWTFVLSEPIRVQLPEKPILKDCDKLFQKERN